MPLGKFTSPVEQKAEPSLCLANPVGHLGPSLQKIKEEIVLLNQLSSPLSFLSRETDKLTLPTAYRLTRLDSH